VQLKAFTKSVEAYKFCLQKFAADQQEIAKAVVATGNAAVKGFNDFSAELNKKIAK
jgi:hypothetical protein